MHARNTTGVQYHVTRSECMHVETYAEVIVCSLPLKVKPKRCVYTMNCLAAFYYISTQPKIE